MSHTPTETAFCCEAARANVLSGLPSVSETYLPSFAFTSANWALIALTLSGLANSS